MGRDKGLVPLAGRPMIEHIIEKVKGIGDEIIITTNDQEAYQYLGYRIASDDDPGAGALTGLHTALSAAESDTVFVTACDMPFLNKALIEHLISLASKADAVVPIVQDRFQPLHAVYGRENCLKAIQSAIAKDEKRAISFYPSIEVLEIEGKEISKYGDVERIFFNVNTPSDLEKAEAMIREKE